MSGGIIYREESTFLVKGKHLAVMMCIVCYGLPNCACTCTRIVSETDQWYNSDINPALHSGIHLYAVHTEACHFFVRILLANRGCSLIRAHAATITLGLK